MAVYKKEITVCHCERCDFEWIPRTALKEPESIPIRCGNPTCNSPYWNLKRKVAIPVVA